MRSSQMPLPHGLRSPKSPSINAVYAAIHSNPGPLVADLPMPFLEDVLATACHVALDCVHVLILVYKRIDVKDVPPWANWRLLWCLG
jgi:hypothetical protein